MYVIEVMPVQIGLFLSSEFCQKIGFVARLAQVFSDCTTGWTIRDSEFDSWQREEHFSPEDLVPWDVALCHWVSGFFV